METNPQKPAEKKVYGDFCRYSPWTAPFFDNPVRKLFQNPEKIVGPCIRPGMTVMDIGCGPGFFTLAMARMVEPEGKVIAIDMQQEMLDLVKKKSDRLGLSECIRFHQCKPDSLGIEEKAGFILSFYMVHEVPDRDALFREVSGLLESGGKYLIVEPFFHVSAEAFEDTLRYAEKAGLVTEKRPKVRLSRAAVLRKG
ncbi:class I SAM-dependent methyltransferase [Methanoregula sp.]|jgi:ubiquinone/menaquinone biosynthesis C-methylase UbiE|uniref:class I SAM-dependent methyltransferase n=1 Tax=Methanoregula sp. TaxID=2052170 RepID=UPI003C29E058